MNESMSFVDAIKSVFSKYAQFNGRARRSEFWWWYLFNMIVSWVLYIPLSILIAKKEEVTKEATQMMLNGGDWQAYANANDPTTMIWVFGIIYILVSLALFIPTLAVWVRRLHDVDKSGHMLWLILVCGIGGLIPLIMCIPDGTPGPNKYGPSPKGIGGEAPFQGPQPVAPFPGQQPPQHI